MKPSINSIEVKALQKIVSEWENNKLKDAKDAITFGTKVDEAKGMRVKLSGTIQPTASDEAKSDTSGVKRLNLDTSDATPITTGYDKAKSDLSGVVRLNSDTSGATAKESGAYNWVASGTPLPPHQSTFKTDVFDATVTTVTDADAITQELKMSGSSAANETTDTSGAKLKVLTSGTTTSTAYDSTITGTKYKFDITTTDLKGGTDYTANSSYTSTETNSTWTKTDINALTANVTAWTVNNNDFAGITDMTGKVTTDVATLCTADIKADIFSCLR